MSEVLVLIATRRVTSHGIVSPRAGSIAHPPSLDGEGSIAASVPASRGGWVNVQNESGGHVLAQVGSAAPSMKLRIQLA